MAEHVSAPAAAPAPPVLAPGPAPAVVLPSVETVISLQRTAGNRATGRALGRALDDRTAGIEAQVQAIREALDAMALNEDPSIQRIFSVVGGNAMPAMLDLSARLNQLGLLSQIEPLIPRSGLDQGLVAQIRGAFGAARGAPGDTSALGQDDKDAIAAFGPAKPGTSGDDPDGNTYVVYSGEVKTYFMSKVDKPRRSSVWLANNPGNSDELGGMGLGTGMKWGKHTFAIFPTMAAGKKALWEKIQTKPTLQAYLNYHLGQQTDGSFPEGNDPNTYLTHIQAKVAWVQFSTTPKEIEERGAVDALLEGFTNAEGITPGTVISAADAQVSAAMAPAQQKTMTFYLKLLGLRS